MSITIYHSGDTYATRFEEYLLLYSGLKVKTKSGFPCKVPVFSYYTPPGSWHWHVLQSYLEVLAIDLPEARMFLKCLV